MKSFAESSPRTSNLLVRLGLYSGTEKRLRWFLFLLMSFGQGPRISHLASSWAMGWWENRSSIIVFTAINTTLTAGTEIFSRTLTSEVQSDSKDHAFMIRDSKGHWRIHQQSLISILMTALASLLAGPVYFFRRSRDRWLFFVGFGALNSALAQSLIGLFQGFALPIDPHRVLFDLCYSGTLKFMMFEIGRSTIVKLRHSRSVARVGAIRVIQDTAMSLIRVTLLNLFRFPG